MNNRLEDRLNQFLDNHWPHMERRMGRMEGEVRILISLGLVIIAGIVTVIVKIW